MTTKTNDANFLTDSDWPALADIEITALCALITAQAAELNAANMDRQSRGEAMAYDGLYCAAWARLEKEMKRRGVIPS